VEVILNSTVATVVSKFWMPPKQKQGYWKGGYFIQGKKPPSADTAVRSWHNAFDSWARSNAKPSLKKMLADAIIKDKPNYYKRKQAEIIENMRKKRKVPYYGKHKK